MNSKLTVLMCTLYFNVWNLALGQSTVFVYDQMSIAPTATYEGSGLAEGGYLGSEHPIQSFTPRFSSLDFVSLYVNGDFQPVSLYINIRSGSPSGAIIGTTDQVVFPGGMVGPTNFLFASPVSVTSGVTYYFEILGTASGGSWGVNRGAYGYAGGMVYFPGGFSSPNSDLWFQEGIIVPAPEPGTLGLGLVGVGVLAWMRRRWC